MRKSIILLTALISLFYYTKAEAAFLIEPFAGIQINSTYDDTTASDKGDVTGTAVGARVGFQNLGFMLGLDYRKSSLKFVSDAAGNADSDFTFTTTGFFVGYDFPMMLRVWGTYVFGHNGDDDDSDLKTFEGSGTVIGIGYKVIPFVSLNLEIGNYQNDKVKSAAGVESDYDSATTSYLLSVSFPISI